MRQESPPPAAGTPGAAPVEAGVAAALESADAQVFLEAWLEMLAGDLPQADTIAVFAEDDSGGAFAPLAVWPFGTGEPRAVESVARQVIAARAACETRDAEGRDQIAAPVLLDGDMAGFVALRFAPREGGIPPAERRRLVWALGWLESRFWHARARDERQRHANAFAAMDLLATVGAERRATAAAQALVNGFAAETGVSRAALGLVRGLPGRGARVRIEAVSGTAWFRRRGKLAHALGDAMEEALDQSSPVTRHPTRDGDDATITVAHADYLGQSGNAAIASAVLYDDTLPIGVLTVETGEADTLDAALESRLEAVAALLGPVMELKRRQHNWIAGRAADAAGDGLAALFGRNRPSYRLATVVVLAALALPFVIERPLQVKADATLKGEREVAAVAPFEGLIARSEVQAGDRVAAGDVLFALDDRDLKLEAEKWRSQLEQLRQEERRALASGDRGEAVLLEAQQGQAEAQLRLADARLRRATVRAPIDGVVISGDASQRIGAPIGEGEQLFALAPLDAYRVELDLDERDLDLVQPGTDGALRLTARTGEALAIEVTSVTSVARHEEGRRLFRADARLAEAPESLRPGMQGVARIDAGERSLAAIWTRRLRDWLTLALWRWTP